MTYAKKKGLDFLYPPACPLCGEILDKREMYVCEECTGISAAIHDPVCLKCGKEIQNEDQSLCEDCETHKRSFVRGFPALNYMEPYRSSLSEFKYNNRRDYADFFANEIMKHQGKNILKVEVDALIPVPVHRHKKKTRGYNQAELLANALSKRFHIPVDTELLNRRIDTLPQKNLDNEAREINLKNAFISSDKIVQYTKVMLVDDIYTTGATIEACTEILLEKGIEEIYFTTVCIGRGY